MYTSLPFSEIRIQIPDLIIDNTVIKREAYCSRMEYNIEVKAVVVFWIVQHYSVLPDGNKGLYLGDVIPDYMRPNIADNNTMCDINTGEPIALDENGQYPETVNYTGQFDFFMYIGENIPIKVNEYIKNFGLMIQDWKKQ